MSSARSVSATTSLPNAGAFTPAGVDRSTAATAGSALVGSALAPAWRESDGGIGGAPRSGDRLAKLVDLHGAHALVVDLDIESADFITCEIAHEEAVDAHAVERADIAGDQRPAFFIGEVERRQRLGRIGLHGGAKAMIAQDLATKMVHRENAHGRLLSYRRSYSAAGSNPRTLGCPASAARRACVAATSTSRLSSSMRPVNTTP